MRPPARQYLSPSHSSPRLIPNSNINVQNMSEHHYHHQYHHCQQKQQEQNSIPPVAAPPPALLPLPLSPQQQIRNVAPSEHSDTEILLAYGYTDIWHLMTQHNLDPFRPADVETAKVIVARLRLDAQGKRDGMAWGGLVEAFNEGKRVGDEGRKGMSYVSCPLVSLLFSNEDHHQILGNLTKWDLTNEWTANQRLREERWQSQNEWANWDREQSEMERSARMRRESLGGRRRYV